MFVVGLCLFLSGFLFGIDVAFYLLVKCVNYVGVKGQTCFLSVLIFTCMPFLGRFCSLN